MIDLQEHLTHTIASRFRDLRKNEHSNLPPDLIANGQKAAILRIEKGEVPRSGNFISDTLLDTYSNYFSLSKVSLIFGEGIDLEKLVTFLFSELSSSLMPSDLRERLRIKPPKSTPSQKVKDSLLTLYYTFADFGRWYDLRKETPQSRIEENPIDFLTMSTILWQLCKERFLASFNEKVIYSVFNEQDEKFYYNRINKKVNDWLNHDFSELIIPECIKKLKKNSIFKIGYMVKALIDEFLVSDLPESYLTNIPLDVYFPPTKHYRIEPIADKEKQEKQVKDIADKWVDSLSKIKAPVYEKDFKKIEEENIFEGIEGITDLSTPFRKGIQKITIEDFLDNLLDLPPFMNECHFLNFSEQKIPGILSVNLQATHLFQKRINEDIEGMIDNLVGIQNHFINLIVWKELSDFAI